MYIDMLSPIYCCWYINKYISFSLMCQVYPVNSIRKRMLSASKYLFNPLIPKIKEQILLSYPHTFLIKVLERSY